MRVTSFVFAWIAIGACADPSPSFGPPGGLQGRTPEDHPPVATDGGGSSSSSGGEGGTAGCTPPGGDAGSDPTCPKFATDIYPMMAASGVWGCAAGGCHVQPGANAPQPMTDAAGTYSLLTGYTSPTMKLTYVNKNCVEPSQSGIICNFAGTCGSGVMPQGKTVASADLDKLKKWISCGSPP